jgi:hypothetical protein
MKIGKTTNRYEFFISDEDSDLLLFATWYLNPKDSYVYESSRIYSLTKHRETLHLIIAKRLNFDQNLKVDHIDGDKLDSQRANLRVATNSQNSMNSRKLVIGSSQYKGVYFDRIKDKFRAKIVLNRKEIFIGNFEDEKQAALAYNEAAIKYHGAFACLNEVH